MASIGGEVIGASLVGGLALQGIVVAQNSPLLRCEAAGRFPGCLGIAGLAPGAIAAGAARDSYCGGGYGYAPSYGYGYAPVYGGYGYAAPGYGYYGYGY